VIPKPARTGPTDETAIRARRQGSTHDRSLDRQHRTGAHRDVAARSSAVLGPGSRGGGGCGPGTECQRTRSAGERAGRLPPACSGTPAQPGAGLADRSSLGDTALQARAWPARVRGLSRRIRGAARYSGRELARVVGWIGGQSTASAAGRLHVPACGTSSPSSRSGSRRLTERSPLRAVRLGVAP